VVHIHFACSLYFSALFIFSTHTHSQLTEGCLLPTVAARRWTGLLRARALTSKNIEDAEPFFIMHLPRVLLLGDVDPAWVGRLAAGLAGAADLVARPVAGLRGLPLGLLGVAARELAPSDGPDFAAVAVVARVVGPPQAPSYTGLARALRDAAGGGAALHLALVPEDGAPDDDDNARLATAVVSAEAAGFCVSTSESACTAGVCAAVVGAAGAGGAGPAPALVPPWEPSVSMPEETTARMMRAWAAAMGPPPGCVRARYAPAPGARLAACTAPPPPRSALLIIDAQNFNCDRRGALYVHPAGGGGPRPPRASPAEVDFFFARLDSEVAPAWAALLGAARAARPGVLVLHTVMAAQDGAMRDTGLDYRASGFLIPPGCWDARPVAWAAPARGEAVLPKTTSSPFASTPLAPMLRAAGVAHLYLAGCVTDQCVAAATTDAADAGFVVTLVRDACLTYSARRHEAALAALSGYCRQVGTAEAVAELGRGGGSSG
jgi:ureidoacrylate peracid hydrolase